MLNNNRLPEIIGPLISVLLLVIGMLSSALLIIYNLDKFYKHRAIHNCYQIAGGKEYSGSLEKNGWSVEKALINQDLFKACLKQKGY